MMEEGLQKIVVDFRCNRVTNPPFYLLSSVLNQKKLRLSFKEQPCSKAKSHLSRVYLASYPGLTASDKRWGKKAWVRG